MVFFSIAFIKKKFSEKLFFTQNGFTFYEKEEIELFSKKAGFKSNKFQDYTENVVGKDGKNWLRHYLIVTMKK